MQDFSKISKVLDVEKRNELLELYNFYIGDVKNYLYKWHKEEDFKFLWRKENSYYKNFIQPIINGLTNLIFIKEHVINVKEIYNKNIDLNNTSLNKFMQTATKNALLFGLTFIIADTNKTDENISIAEEKVLNIRGFLKEFTYLQLVNYRYENNKLFSIVFEDVEYYYKNDFEAEIAVIYYHYFIGGGNKYRKVNNKFELISSWNNDLDYIPIEIIYGSNDSNYLNASSIVSTIKNLNKSHYNLNSGIMNISHIASNPVPIMYGLPQNSSNDKNITLGVNSLILFPTNQGNAYKFEWQEIKGSSVAIAERELERLENYIIDMSFDILRVEKFTTATEAKIKENKNKSILSLILNSLETAINHSLENLKLLTNQDIGSIELNRDLSNISLNADILNAIINLRKDRDISLDTLYKILTEGEIVKIDDIEKEKEKIIDEIEKGV
jgi:hypothetical protein